MAGHKDLRERVKYMVKDRVRLMELIEVEDLLIKLQKFALSRLLRNTETQELQVPDDLHMTQGQIYAALKLIGKVMPDIAAVEHTINPENFEVGTEPMTAEQWAAKHGATVGTVQ